MPKLAKLCLRLMLSRRSYMYSWWKPGPPYFHPSLIARISRTIGFLPLVILGSPLVILGSPLLFLPTAMPHKARAVALYCRH